MKKISKKKPTTKVAITKGKEKVKEVEIPVNDNKELQQGIMPTNAKLKEKPPLGYATVGLALGVTLNMGDYQSARVDVFIQRNVEDNPTAIKDAMNEISVDIHEELQRQSELLDEE